MATTAFKDRVLRVVRAIPHGRVASYGDVATLTGTPRAARAVGTVLKSHVHAGDEVPWHRVISASGRISFKGDITRAAQQRALLEAEGLSFRDDTVAGWPEPRWDGSGAPHFFDEAVTAGFIPPDFEG